MNLFKFSQFSLGSLVVLSFLFTNVVYAVDPTATPAPKVAPDPALVATVNIDEAKVVSQNGNTLRIGFTISNGKGLQTGVKYGVQLIRDGAAYISDEKVFDESITLYENTSVKKELTYTAPSQFSGSYNIYITAKNESSFPFAIKSVGKVNLVSSTKGISIMNTSCYIQVVGEKNSPKYKLLESVDISSTESLKLTCNTTNESGQDITVTPNFETRYFSAYGKVAQATGGDMTPISFTKGEKKVVSVLMPKSDKPQFYNVKFSLAGTGTTSNSVSANYIIRGVNGTIHKLSLDKDGYNKNSKGEISLIWSASAGNFSRSGTNNGALPKVTANVSMVGEGGKECSNPLLKYSLVRQASNPFTIIPKQGRRNPSCVCFVTAVAGLITV